MNALDVIRIKMHQILTCLNNTTYICISLSASYLKTAFVKQFLLFSRDRNFS